MPLSDKDETKEVFPAKKIFSPFFGKPEREGANLILNGAAAEEEIGR